MPLLVFGSARQQHSSRWPVPSHQIRQIVLWESCLDRIKDIHLIHVEAMVKAPSHGGKQPPPAPLIVQGRAVSATSVRSGGSGRTTTTTLTASSSASKGTAGGIIKQRGDNNSNKKPAGNRPRPPSQQHQYTLAAAFIRHCCLCWRICSGQLPRSSVPFRLLATTPSSLKATLQFLGSAEHLKENRSHTNTSIKRRLV